MCGTEPGEEPWHRREAHGDLCSNTDPPQLRDTQVLEERSQQLKKVLLWEYFYSGANPSQELVSPKPGRAPAAGATCQAGMAGWGLLCDLTVGLWLQPSWDLNGAAPCTSPRRRREILVSNLYSYSRALHLILQFCTRFDNAGWCSLGVASKSRNTL